MISPKSISKSIKDTLFSVLFWVGTKALEEINSVTIGSKLEEKE
jgi:hypothetical protein